MNDVDERPVLVLGASGKTGSQVAAQLSHRGIPVRTASRHDCDVRFDWDDPATFGAALDGTGAIYLVAPVMRTNYAEIVSDFLDQAESAGVGHVTYLSAYGADQAPPEFAIRAVELTLAQRPALSHSMIRPAWFMQNFSESFVMPVDDTIAVPNGDGSEAFVHANDIASVAAATLADPRKHAGAAYAPTGPESLTVTEAAQLISTAVGRTITYGAIDQTTWVDAMVAAGIPPDYAAMLRLLTSTIASGNGSRPNDDVLTVTGRSPISFATFAAAAASKWR